MSARHRLRDETEKVVAIIWEDVLPYAYSEISAGLCENYLVMALVGVTPNNDAHIYFLFCVGKDQIQIACSCAISLYHVHFDAAKPFRCKSIVGALELSK